MIVAIIPARAGSKRLENKNFLPCNGVSLVDRAMKVAEEAKIFDAVYLTTDESRHPYICDDHVQTAAVVFDTLAKLNYAYDQFCVLNPTTPTRTAENIRDAWNYYRAEQMISLVSGEKPVHDGAVLFQNTLYFLREMKIIPDYAGWIKFTNEQVDINTREDFDRAEKILAEREGPCRSVTT